MRTRRKAATGLADTERWGHRRSQLLQWLFAFAALVVFGVALARSASASDPPQPVGIISRIQRHPVESRALAAIGYSSRLRALEVEFRRGGTYRYLEVPRSVYDALLTAESKAGFYNQNVRGKYKSVYVRPRRKR